MRAVVLQIEMNARPMCVVPTPLLTTAITQLAVTAVFAKTDMKKKMALV